MVIYGTALIAGCYLAGSLMGQLLGQLLGIPANIGGVGFAMLLFLLITNYLLSHNKIKPATEQGIRFWQGMYIPITVAMSAAQNVVSAISSGTVAVLAGILAALIAFACVPLLGKIGKDDTSVMEGGRDE